MKRPSRYQPTRQAGIRRDRASGLYYLHKKIHGATIDESLETTDWNEAIARFFARVERLIADGPARDPLVGGTNLNLGELAKLYLERLAAGACGDKSAGTIKTAADLLMSIRRTWTASRLGDFDSAEPSAVTFDQLLAWRKQCLDPQGCGLSAATLNKFIHILRGLFRLAVERECLVPARDGSIVTDRLKAARIQIPQYLIPTPEQFAKILSYYDEVWWRGDGKHGRDLVEGLSYTGLRKSEAAALRADWIDLKAWTIHLPAEAVKGRMGDRRPRTFPILHDARPLFTRLVANARPDGAVFRVREVTRSLANACKFAGWPHRFTHHTLRHYFGTRCLQAGIPVQEVAAWLGHRDGGALLLRIYAHACPQFAASVAERLKGWKLDP